MDSSALKRQLDRLLQNVPAASKLIKQRKRKLHDLSDHRLHLNIYNHVQLKSSGEDLHVCAGMGATRALDSDGNTADEPLPIFAVGIEGAKKAPKVEVAFIYDQSKNAVYKKPLKRCAVIDRDATLPYKLDGRHHHRIRTHAGTLI